MVSGACDANDEEENDTPRLEFANYIFGFHVFAVRNRQSNEITRGNEEADINLFLLLYKYCTRSITREIYKLH